MTEPTRDLAATAPVTGLARWTGRPALPPPVVPPTTFVRPSWLLVHLATVVLAVAMVLLGRWQLQVSNDKHFDLQNFAYAFQWWIFTAFLLFFWVRLIRHTRRPPVDKDVRLVVRTESGDRLDDGRFTGLAQLVVPADDGGTKVSYLGYVMPRSAASPARSDGDSYHASYNDMLWGLAMADEPEEVRPSQAPAVEAAREPRIIDVTPERPLES